MKKALLIFLVFTTFLSVCTAVGAHSIDTASVISVYLNNELLSFDVSPIITDGRAMVPMRKIFESLGSVVNWDAPTKTVNVEKDEITINLTVDSKTMFVNGEPKILDVSPIIIDSRTLVPLRAVAESFDCKVDWIAETQSVKITTADDFVYKKPVLNAVEIYEKLIPSVFFH